MPDQIHIDCSCISGRAWKKFRSLEKIGEFLILLGAYLHTPTGRLAFGSHRAPGIAQSENAPSVSRGTIVILSSAVSSIYPGAFNRSPVVQSHLRLNTLAQSWWADPERVRGVLRSLKQAAHRARMSVLQTAREILEQRASALVGGPRRPRASHSARRRASAPERFSITLRFFVKIKGYEQANSKAARISTVAGRSRKQGQRRWSGSGRCGLSV